MSDLSDIAYKQKILAFVSDFVLDEENIVLVGDFNLPDVDWSTLSASTDFSNQFCDLVFQHNLLQLVNNPTHVCGNILDLVLTNSDDIITSLSVDPIMSPHLQSDHFRVSFNISTSLHCPVKILLLYQR